MSAYRHVPLAPGGPGRVAGRPNFWVLAIVAVAAFELLGTVAAPSVAGSPPWTPASVPVGPHPAQPAAVDTHGDLVVTSGEKVYLPEPRPPPTPTTYYQGGNITVENGGTLIVQNLTLSFVQYVGDVGVPSARLHVYRFVIEAGGTAIISNSTITTDTFVLNPYVKLQVVVDGALTLWHSEVATAGSIVVGTGGDLTLNDSSSLAPSTTVSGLDVPAAIAGDVAFSPTLSVSGGGSVNLFDSTYRALYGDNIQAQGTPYPFPVNSSGTVPVASTTNWSSFVTPTSSAALAQDYLYPSGIEDGNLTIRYNDTSGSPTTASVTVWYGGVSCPLGPATFLADTTGSVILPFAPGSALTNAINAGGMMGWLNRTGDFGLPSGIYVAFTVTSGPTIANASLKFQLVSPLAFGPSVTGANSVLSTVDSYLGLNFTSLAAEPWQTHQLTLTDGAEAYLANLSTQGTFQNGTSQFAHNAIVADTTSSAYLFRWAYLAITGNNPALLVVNATVTAPYAYGSSQSNNATAQAANAFKTSDPAIWGYLQWWDAEHGVAAYGRSSTNGVASLLLASNYLNASSGPDGNYLGTYHVIVSPPPNVRGSQSFNASIPPYPLGVANGSAGYGLPTAWGEVSFSGYYASAVISAHNGIVVTANGVVTTTVPIGQTLGVAVNITDIGTAPVTSLNGTLYYSSVGKEVLATTSEAVDLTVPGQNATVRLTWAVNDTVVGVLGNPVNSTLVVVIVWNDNETSKGGGTQTALQPVEFVAGMAIAHNGLTVQANGVNATTMRIGEVLGLSVTLLDNTSTPITYLQGTLYDVSARNAVLATYAKNLNLNAPGQKVTFKMAWKVNDSVVGLKGGPVNNTLSLTVVWNEALVSENGGLLVATQLVKFTPSDVTVTNVTALSSQLSSSQKYLVSGDVTYNGSQDAYVALYATPVGGLPVLLGSVYASPASIEGMPTPFAIAFYGNQLTAGTTYTLSLDASYNSVNAVPYAFPGTYSVPAPAPTSFLTHKFLGLELWLWIAIAAAIVVAVVGFLLLTRRQAAGKLVECGECGNLVPETAKVCPKCGAEFESDVVRCSRCSSTIPASSKFCPECAAQLLGKPGEGEIDPERQAYADFTERFRAEAKKELGDNYSESSFWDWWKRQPSYTPFSQWKVQQGQGTTRAGMTAPPPGSPPPGGAAPAPSGTPRPAARPPPRRPQAQGAPAAPTAAAPPPAAAPAPAAPAPAPAASALKPCPNCHKEIPPEYLVCPFCGSVTQ